MSVVGTLGGMGTLPNPNAMNPLLQQFIQMQMLQQQQALQRQQAGGFMPISAQQGQPPQSAAPNAPAQPNSAAPQMPGVQTPPMSAQQPTHPLAQPQIPQIPQMPQMPQMPNGIPQMPNGAPPQRQPAAGDKSLRVDEEGMPGGDKGDNRGGFFGALNGWSDRMNTPDQSGHTLADNLSLAASLIGAGQPSWNINRDPGGDVAQAFANWSDRGEARNERMDARRNQKQEQGWREEEHQQLISQRARMAAAREALIQQDPSRAELYRNAPDEAIAHIISAQAAPAEANDYGVMVRFNPQTGQMEAVTDASGNVVHAPGFDEARRWQEHMVRVQHSYDSDNRTTWGPISPQQAAQWPEGSPIRRHPEDFMISNTGAVQPIHQRGLYPADAIQAAGFASRLVAADRVMREIEGRHRNDAGFWSAIQNSVVGTVDSGNDDVRAYRQAAREFSNAQLRHESGAVIGPSEFTSALQQYYPTPADAARGSTSFDQHAAARQRSLQGMINESQGAYEDYYSGGAPSTPSAQSGATASPSQWSSLSQEQRRDFINTWGMQGRQNLANRLHLQAGLPEDRAVAIANAWGR